MIEMVFCEDCKWYKQHYWEDKASCQKKQQPTEADKAACEGFEAPEDQTKLEV